ncbi:MAG: SBBP repeat-containing protein, partial [Terriglobales bacterium]
VAQYDHSRRLVIDPVLSYSTYLGGNGVDEATAIAVDSAGNAYITGDTTSTNFPVTGAPATGDMFVAKLDPNGAKVYATYVGGTAQLDFPTGIGVDVLGNAYVAGQTGETNLPTTAGALRTTYQGGTFDGFVFSLNAAGTGFNYFTYLGGSAFDLLAAVAVDSLGNAYITGQTDSGDYPILNPFETLATAGDGGIFTTTNSGANWNASATGLVNRNITVVAVDPKTPTTIYAATLESGVIKSTNSGGAWSAINTGLTSLVIQALVVDPVTPANVYVGTGRGGVFVSHNGGTSWATMNAGLVGINVHAMAIDPTSPGTLYASTGGNGVFKFTGSAWSPTGAVPQDVATAIVVDPTNNQNVYVSFQNSGVYRSSNGGTSWAAFNTGLTSLQVAALAIDHTGHLYAGTRNGGVFLSTSGGNWTTIDTGLPLGVFQALATDPINNTTVYVGTWNGGVYRSTNNGASWSEAANNGLNNVRISALVVDPQTPANLYAGSQNVEAVVTKLSPSGALAFSSYLGGGGGEAGLGIAIDGDNGNLYVAGFTNSLNFPTVAAAQTSMVGGLSGFVSKVKSDGSGLVYSTYLGGPLSSSSGSLDQANAIAADAGGNAYVTGITNSTGFPVANATQATLAGTSNAFVARYNASGQKLFATYLGGESTDAGNAITVTANTDGSTSAWIAGQTTSNFFPLANPIQLERGNENSASNAGFISDFNFPASGAAPTLAFSTYLGTGCGSGCDTVAQAIGRDGANNIYVAGRTMSNSFPTVNAVQNSLAGTQNAFIAKIGATTNNADLSLTLNSFGPTTVVAGATVNFSLTVTNNGPNPATNVALGGRGGANLSIITCTVTQGVCGDNLQVLDRGFAELGTLASGASATVTGVLRPLSACGVAGVPTCPFLIVVDARSDANDPNPSNNSATTNLTVLPGADLAVTLSASPSPAPVQVGGTLNYLANVSNLGPSNASNVTAVFTLAPATAATFVSLPPGCTNSAPGTLTCLLGPMPAGTAGLDSIPATVNSLPITAEIVVSNTPEADPDPTNNSAIVTTTLSASGVNNAELNGQYAFLLRGFDPSGQAIAVAGSFTADGAGHITGGVKDVNIQNSSVAADLSITAASSSYSVGADNRGILTLTTSAGTETFDFSVGSISSGVASLGHIISRRTASATNGSAISGVFKKQDPAAFTLAALNGDWAFLNEGVDGSGGRFANAGRFTLSAGNITNGSEDFNDNGVFDNGTTTALTITGSLGSVDTNGRVPLTAGSGTPGHTAVYIVSANEALTMSIDPISANPLASGSALRQSTTFCPTTGGCNFTNSALNGNAVVYLQGNSSSGVAGASDVNVGVLTFNLATASFSGSLDENDGGTIYCPAADLCANPGGSTASGNYSVASNGRVTLTLGNGENNPPFFYMVNTNQAFLIGSSSGHVNAGVAENQVGPIANNSFSSAFGTEPPAVSGSLMFSGVLTATAINSTNSSLTGTTDDINSVGPIPDITGGGLHEDVSVEDDTTTLDPATGRFTFASGTKVGYFINSSRLVTIDIEPTNTAPYIIISDNQSSSIGAKPDLGVGITANPSTGVFVGGPITYTVTVSGKNSTPATGVVLATALSPSLTVNSVTPSQGSCNATGLPASLGSFSCNLGTVTQGTPVTVTIAAIAPASGIPCATSPSGCIIVASSAAENEIEFNPVDNTATVITPILQASATTCTGTTTNWLGGTGNWSDSTKWSTGVVPNSTSVNVCIDNGNAVASQVTLDISASVGNLTIDANDSLIIGNNTALTIAGNISNSGQISVNAAGNNTFLQIAGGRNVSLSGGGTLTLSTSGNGTPIINQTSGGATLTNVDNTIQGRGQIGNNGLALVNQAAGTIKANVAATLLLNPNGITNAGTLAATTGGTLQTTTTVNNAGGTISSTGSGSAVQFLNGTTVQGGTLNGSAGGVLGTAASNTATLDGTTQGALSNAGTYTGANNSITVLRGTITN